jgi:hypothetical protein
MSNIRTEKKTSAKNSASRLFVSVFMFILQIVWIEALVYALREHAERLNLIFIVIAIIVVLKMYVKTSNAALRTPWIIAILAFPIMGLPLSFLYGQPIITKKSRAKFQTITDYMNQFMVQDQGVANRLDSIDKGISNEFKYLYNLEDSFESKLNIICREIYRASNIIYSEKALNKINILKENNLSNLPVCVAKTQYSITDDKNKLLVTEPYDIHVEDINIYNGAGFITVLLGNILTMPGLPKVPNYENIKLDEENNIIGIK